MNTNFNVATLALVACIYLTTATVTASQSTRASLRQLQGDDYTEGDDAIFIDNEIQDLLEDSPLFNDDVTLEDWLTDLLNDQFPGGVDGLEAEIGDALGLDLEGLGDMGLDDFLGLDDLDFGDFLGDDFGVCSIIEDTVGMAPAFGVEGNCTCSGDFATGLNVDCAFTQCGSGESDVCGEITITIAVGGPDATTETSVCVDFPNDPYEKTCFKYTMVFSEEDGTATLSQACEATYGGNLCECSIDGATFCLDVDCTPFLEGGKFDTCQALTMTDAGDVSNFFPGFEVFQPGFELPDNISAESDENLPVDIVNAPTSDSITILETNEAESASTSIFAKGSAHVALFAGTIAVVAQYIL